MPRRIRPLASQDRAQELRQGSGDAQIARPRGWRSAIDIIAGAKYRFRRLSGPMVVARIMLTQR
jgi:hypothetical protein